MSFPFNFHFPGIYIIFGYICYILEFVVRFGTLSLSYILLLYITNEFEQLCYKREKKYVIQTSPDVIQTAALCITVAALCNTDDSVCSPDGPVCVCVAVAPIRLYYRRRIPCKEIRVFSKTIFRSFWFRLPHLTVSPLTDMVRSTAHVSAKKKVPDAGSRSEPTPRRRDAAVGTRRDATRRPPVAESG